MHISNLSPVAAPPMPDGSILLARFELEVVDGITARLSLVKSGRDGADLVWSTKGPSGPAVRLSPEARCRIAAMARAGLAEFAANMRAA